MTITVAFLVVIAAVLVGGAAYQRWDEAHHLRFVDEAGTGAATAALARFESRAVLTHPTWLITLAVLTALTTTLIVLEPGGTIPFDTPVTWFAVIGVPVAGLGLVVSLHRIGTRSRRHRTEELEAATPTAPRARTTALLVACCAPAPVLLGAMLLGLVTSQLAYSLMPPPSPSNLLPMVGFVLAGVGGAVVGVLLSRWLPFAAAPLLGLVAIVWLNNGVDQAHPRFRWLRVAVETDYGRVFDVRPVGWSVVFILALIVLGGCLALWRHPAQWKLTGVTAAALLFVAATGWAMTRSPSSVEIDDRVDLLERPTAHQHCETRDEANYCVFPGAEAWIDAWHPALLAVLAQVPAAARPERLEVVQRPRVGTAWFLDAVVEKLDPATAWPTDGRIHPPLDIEDERAPDMTVAWQTAALAVGLPPATDWERPGGCLAGGQARLVLTHLLAARATATTGDALEAKAAQVRDSQTWAGPVPMDLEYDYDIEMGRYVDAGADPRELLAADGRTLRDHFAVAGASGWGSDMVAAEALAGADRATVDRAVATHWDELVDPATPTSRLLDLAGVEATAALHGDAAARTDSTEAVACP